MLLPTVQGTIKRRVLLNFRADPTVVAAGLPAPLRPKLQGGHAVVGVCLIRLEQLRPVGFPVFLGAASENAAHRIAVEWDDPDGTLREGVFVVRRDTGSALNRWAGGRVFPGEQHAASFSVEDTDHSIRLSMESEDGEASVEVWGEDAPYMPKDSCFASLAEASRFFEAGSVGFSPSRDPASLGAVRLWTYEWDVWPMAVLRIRASYFEDGRHYPPGTVVFDHALVMRDVAHQWRAEPDLESRPRSAFTLA
ncbi:MAG: DUF2071 domain-containing protein [Armatimonadetes bacterium]|nr:DUF2071 domain-containing protein [Armatimonadota bacterium]